MADRHEHMVAVRETRMIEAALFDVGVVSLHRERATDHANRAAGWRAAVTPVDRRAVVAHRFRAARVRERGHCLTREGQTFRRAEVHRDPRHRRIADRRLGRHHCVTGSLMADRHEHMVTVREARMVEAALFGVGVVSLHRERAADHADRAAGRRAAVTPVDRRAVVAQHFRAAWIRERGHRLAREGQTFRRAEVYRAARHRRISHGDVGGVRRAGHGDAAVDDGGVDVVNTAAVAGAVVVVGALFQVGVCAGNREDSTGQRDGPTGDAAVAPVDASAVGADRSGAARIGESSHGCVRDRGPFRNGRQRDRHRVQHHRQDGRDRHCRLGINYEIRRVW